jgi:hypothetical protein
MGGTWRRRAIVLSALMLTAIPAASPARSAPRGTGVPTQTTWQIMPTPNPAGATAAVIDAVSCATVTSCIAVGYDETASGASGIAEKWDGATWQLTAPPPNTRYLLGVACTTPSSCIAVRTS